LGTLQNAVDGKWPRRRDSGRSTPAADGDEPSTLTRPGHAEAPFRYVQSDFELHFPGGQVRACPGLPFDIDHPGDTAAIPQWKV
jgi:hypothetical protein